MEPSEDRAALHGMEERLFKMVSNGATSTLWSKWLQPPLEQAIGEGDLDLVLSLLKAGADASAGWRGSRGRTLLELAAEGGNEKIVSALLGAGSGANMNAISDESNMSVLYRAIVGGHTAAARVLMEAGALVDREDENECTALHLAVMYGDRELVEYILIAQAHVNAVSGDGDTPLHKAAARGDCTIISTLLKAGANQIMSNMMGFHALHMAVRHGHIHAAEVLLKAGADPNFGDGASENWPLRFAIKSSAMTRLLLQNGADVNACDGHGLTLLHFAAAEPNCGSGVIDALIEAGAEVEARTFDSNDIEGGQTPLHCAAGFRDVPAMEALLRNGADINAEDNYGQSPLHYVCSTSPDEDSVQTADFLLRQGADETAIDHGGCTPEHRIDGRAGYAESLRRLLASAPGDRAWRRRALLVLCRAFPDRLKRRGSEGEAAKVLCQGEGVRTDSDADRRGEDERVLVRVVEVEVEAIFRMIVGFL